MAADLIEDGRLLVPDMLTQANCVVVQSCDEISEQRLSLCERQSAQGVSVQVQQIEYVIVQRMCGAFLKGSLQRSEAADAALIEHNYFAVQQRGLCGQRLERRREGPHAMRPVEAAAG